MLYQIQLDDEEGDAGTWDGTVNVLKRNTQKTVEKSSKILLSRIEKLQENINESTSQEKNSDRELKSNLRKITGFVRKIEKKQTKLEDEFTLFRMEVKKIAVKTGATLSESEIAKHKH